MLPLGLLDEWLKNALREDIGSGDVTTDTLVPLNLWGKAEVIAKESFLVAGLEAALRVFPLLSPAAKSEIVVADGSRVSSGQILARVQAPVRALLSGERVAMNLVQHLSGVATLTRRFVEEVEGTGVRIFDTRKTLPGLRVFEKYAVRVGGGANHRASLSEAVLIKENHIRACGGIREAVKGFQQGSRPLLTIEVECTTCKEAEEALGAGASRILLDNMTVEQIREVVERLRGRANLEVSGGVTLENVRRIAETGINSISVGRITHSAPGADISMLVKDVWTGPVD